MTDPSPGVVKDDADWRGPELAERIDWLRPLTGAQISEIGAALEHFESTGKSIGQMAQEDFPLLTFAADLREMRGLLQTGPGMQMYRGFPVREFTKSQLRQIFWGIGLHLGTARAQSRHGEMIGDVRQIVEHGKSFSGRSYTSSDDLHFHCDSSDVVGLFCLRVAKEGGISRAVSVVAIHNEMARTRPDLLAALYRPLIYSWRDRQPPGVAPDYEQPMFAISDGKFVSRVSPSYIRYGYEKRGIDMLADQKEALNMLMSLTEDPAFFMEKEFEEGDIQFINNLRLLHARTEFTDHPDPDEKRHLLRIWLAVPDSPRLPGSFAPYYGGIAAGSVRGGYWTDKEPVFETIFAQ
ncbi:MAG: TauD/TfdA family dioxygenase [Pseudomonadota bacterium]|nr:TauD/TfdA family dioxygenase [Pseudomonadota bacterium]